MDKTTTNLVIDIPVAELNFDGIKDVHVQIKLREAVLLGDSAGLARTFGRATDVGGALDAIRETALRSTAASPSRDRFRKNQHTIGRAFLVPVVMPAKVADVLSSAGEDNALWHDVGRWIGRCVAEHGQTGASIIPGLLSHSYLSQLDPATLRCWTNAMTRDEVIQTVRMQSTGESVMPCLAYLMGVVVNSHYREPQMPAADSASYMTMRDKVASALQFHCGPTSRAARVGQGTATPEWCQFSRDPNDVWVGGLANWADSMTEAVIYWIQAAALVMAPVGWEVDLPDRDTPLAPTVLRIWFDEPTTGQSAHWRIPLAAYMMGMEGVDAVLSAVQALCPQKQATCDLTGKRLMLS